MIKNKKKFLSILLISSTLASITTSGNVAVAKRITSEISRNLEIPGELQEIFDVNHKNRDRQLFWLVNNNKILNLLANTLHKVADDVKKIDVAHSPTVREKLNLLKNEWSDILSKNGFAWIVYYYENDKYILLSLLDDALNSEIGREHCEEYYDILFNQEESYKAMYNRLTPDKKFLFWGGGIAFAIIIGIDICIEVVAIKNLFFK